MKPIPTVCIMLALATATAITSFFLAVPGQGLAAFLLSAVPVWSLHGGVRLWKPWFMAGVDDEQPDLTIFVIQAAVLESLAITALVTGIGWPFMAFRLIGTMVQLATCGKLTRDVNANTHHDEIRRTPASRPGKGHPRKP